MTATTPLPQITSKEDLSKLAKFEVIRWIRTCRPEYQADPSKLTPLLQMSMEQLVNEAWELGKHTVGASAEPAPQPPAPAAQAAQAAPVAQHPAPAAPKGKKPKPPEAPPLDGMATAPPVAPAASSVSGEALSRLLKLDADLQTTRNEILAVLKNMGMQADTDAGGRQDLKRQLASIGSGIDSLNQKAAVATEATLIACSMFTGMSVDELRSMAEASVLAKNALPQRVR